MGRLSEECTYASCHGNYLYPLTIQDDKDRPYVRIGL